MEQLLPEGLYLCAVCGEPRGASGGEVSTCLCAGLVCTRCGLRKRRRPMTDYFDAARGYFVHVPHTAGFGNRPCPSCLANSDSR